MTVVSVAGDGAERARLELERCVAGGGVAVFPADTLYGLACDPQSEPAIRRIHELKGRDDGKPAAVMFFAPLEMRAVLAMLDGRTRDALGALLPGPVTAVVPNPERRYPLACREDPERLGVRLIEGPLAGVRCAVFQTSANRSGEPPPSRFEDVDRAIVDGADLAIDGGDLGGEPSTVVDLTALAGECRWEVLREGALPAAEVARRLRALISQH